MLVSVFHGKHESFLFKSRADLLWNYFSYSVFCTAKTCANFTANHHNQRL
ncbi:hypothetical protein HMPREF9346_03892 [Escherichia coli MS 119-7]|nr:hypothetical protein HMPREF9346_03892 [Escherichia coli MS 119-7]